MKPYAQYKTTNLDWLPRVPTHWEVKPFKRVAIERDVRNIGLQETRVLSLSYGRIIVRDMTKSNLLPASFETYQIIEPGNIIFRLTDLQNDHRSLRTGLVEHRGIITSAYLCVATREELLSNYFASLLRVYDLQKMFYGFGGGVRQSIGYEELKALPVIVPPIEEQRRIVAYLAAKHRDIEGYIAAKRGLLTKLKELSAAVISAAVTRGLNPEVETKPSGVEWLGDVPEHWEVKRLKWVAKEILRWPEDNQQRLLSVSHLTGVTINEKENIRSGDLATYKCVSTNDMVINIMLAWQGSFGVSDYDGIVSPAYCVYRFAPNHSAKWFDYLFRTPSCLAEFARRSRGIVPSRWRLYTEDLFDVKVPLPPLHEQAAIVAHIEEKLAVIRDAQGRIEREIELARELLSTLVAEVVTGQVDVSDWESDGGNLDFAAPFPDSAEENLDLEEGNTDLEEAIL